MVTCALPELVVRVRGQVAIVRMLSMTQRRMLYQGSRVEGQVTIVHISVSEFGMAAISVVSILADTIHWRLCAKPSLTACDNSKTASIQASALFSLPQLVNTLHPDLTLLHSVTFHQLQLLKASM